MKTSTISSRLNEDLETIQSSLIGIDRIATILYGGYGRDEGSWFEDENGNLHPYNDYDIVLVTAHPQPADRIKSIGDKLAKDIGIRWINLSQITPDRLRGLTPTIFNYDLKHASRIIDGDKDILELIPPLDASKLPLTEGEELFFTRIWTLLGCLDASGFQKERTGDASRFFRNQMAKAVLATVDVLLLQKGAYHPSYRERSQRFCRLFAEKDSLVELSRWALQEKLHPTAPAMKADEIKHLYTNIHTHFFREMFAVLTQCYGTPINCARDLEQHLKYDFTFLARRLKSALRNFNLAYEHRLAVRLAQVYLATAYGAEAIDSTLLTRGIELMRRVRPALSPGMNWDQARLAVAQLRMEV